MTEYSCEFNIGDRVFSKLEVMDYAGGYRSDCDQMIIRKICFLDDGVTVSVEGRQDRSFKLSSVIAVENAQAFAIAHLNSRITKIETMGVVANG